MLAQAERLLQQYYGYTHFLPGQATVIESILNGRDTFVIMPTGAGKSVCYQIPALLQPGVTLVISPLISLMKDQVDALDSLGIPCAFINSSISYREVRDRLRGAEQGIYKLLYVAPERLESEVFLDFARSRAISLVAIDEAHCISQWGHDFRTSYRNIAPFIDELPERPLVAAFTATATAEVKADIIHLLKLTDPAIHVTGFDRANLSFSVRRGADKKAFLLRFLEEHREDSGIIYAGTRKEVERLHDLLKSRGYAVGKYHAGLGDGERTQSQEEFLYDNIRVMVATNAFGMGIDKSNVRYVVHYNMPKNMEAYYQEAGRAGRDGDPGECVMLFSPQDIFLNKYLIEQTTLAPERKANELRKLKTMVEYCHTGQCLRRFILSYFGEENPPENCGNCGTCVVIEEEIGSFKVEDETRLILECIHLLRERYGVSILVDVLKGTNRRKYLEAGWDRLSSFGKLAEYSRDRIRERINALVAEDYLRVTDGKYPVVKFTEKARAYCGENVTEDQIKVKPLSVPSDISALFTKLKGLRKAIAEEEGVPPYIVFADSTLHAMTAQLPKNLMEMRLVKGVGQRKLDRYGQRFLDILQEYQATMKGPKMVGVESPLDSINLSDENEPQEDRGETTKPQPSHEVSYAMHRNGQSVECIARQRGLTMQTITTHLIRCADEGLAVDWNELIPGEHEVLVLEQIARLGTVHLKPIKENLPPDVTYATISAVIAKYRKRDNS